MLKIIISREAQKFMRRLLPKHERQPVTRVVELASEPDASDTKQLVGYGPLRCADSGEYRIIYYVDKTELRVMLIGKRNDDAVYRTLRKKMR